MKQPAESAANRDYSQISPSAKSLLMLKGLTNIPFARETAELVCHPEEYVPDYSNKDLAFWKRVVHFENRYWCVDRLLSEVSISNILELSSGYSFRGLDTVIKHPGYYVDTDLQNIIDQKNQLLTSLKHGQEKTAGMLETKPLNALDEKNFLQITASFPEGPLCIVNEGLLMYLNEAEKRALCKTIRQALHGRTGYWITGDIYVKTQLERLKDKNDSLKDLVEQQNIEANMFGSFDTAKKFFEDEGFVIDGELTFAGEAVSSIPYLFQNATPEQLAEMQESPKIQTSWRLKCV